jgi:hypothetical protein
MQCFCGKARKKEAIRGHSHRQEDNIKMDLRERGWHALELSRISS